MTRLIRFCKILLFNHTVHIFLYEILWAICALSPNQLCITSGSINGAHSVFLSSASSQFVQVHSSSPILSLNVAFHTIQGRTAFHHTELAVIYSKRSIILLNSAVDLYKTHTRYNTFCFVCNRCVTTWPSRGSSLTRTRSRPVTSRVAPTVPRRTPSNQSLWV